MQLSIVGCPDKERFRPYVKRAAIFYTNELISKKLLENNGYCNYRCDVRDKKDCPPK